MRSTSCRRPGSCGRKPLLPAVQTSGRRPLAHRGAAGGGRRGAGLRHWRGFRRHVACRALPARAGGGG